MPSVMRSSRRRYEDYRERIKRRRKDPDAATDATIPAPRHDDGLHKKRPRTRSFSSLLRSFWGLLRGHHGSLIWILLALSISTLLGLAPLYGTKLVFDGVLREKPL